jgi:HlyD family secretion protein
MKKNSRRFWIPGLVTALIAVIGVGFLVVPRLQPAATAQTVPDAYQTVPARQGSLDVSIGAAGVVRSRQTAMLVWQTSGTVDQINVTKGQVVPADTVIAQLDPTSLTQPVILAQASLVTARKNLDILLNTNQARANAELALDKAQKALDDANKARNNKQFQVASQETIDIARANLVLANKALDDATTIYNRNKNRDANDVVFASALSIYATAQQRYNAAKYNLDYVSGLPNALDVETADALLDVAQANVLAAKLEWERQKDGPNDQDVAAAQAQVNAAQAILNMAHISAPFQGTVSTVTSKVGDQVNTGTLGFQLDDLSHLYVDVDVTEVDIPRVKVGQSASLTLDAFPGQEFLGQVTDISTGGHNVSGTVNFTVTVEITNPMPTIRPGMTAAVTISAGQGQGAMLVPSRAIRVQNGKQVVCLLKNGALAPVIIIPGASTGADTEIMAGDIHAGDLVVLNPPALPAVNTVTQ